MLNKYFIITLFILLSSAAWGQDNIELAEPQNIEEFTPADADTVTFTEITPRVTDTVTFRERAFAQDFKENYNGNEFVYERKPRQKSQWDRFKEWLAHFLDGLFGNSTGKGFSIATWIIAGTILLVVVYFIVRAILNNESMWIFGRQRKKIYAEDVIEQNIHEMDFSKLVNDTKATGDYRLAVRYYYLWVLKRMSLREIIDWHWQKTNSDYLYEIADKNIRKDFEYLSYLYDYSWYGEFPLDEAAFIKAEKAFQKTLNTL